MADAQFHIATQRGHSKRLRFGFCPVSPKIMNADRDWPEKEELCCSTLCGQELLYPFIRRYFHGKFRKYAASSIFSGPIPNHHPSSRTPRDSRLIFS